MSPDHHLSIVPASLNMRVMLSQSCMQMTREESHLLKTLHPTQLSSALMVKQFLQTFFECSRSNSFFTIPFPKKNIHCLIVVNEILFDYQHKTPAIDLAFCFVDDFDRLDIMNKWESVSRSSKVHSLPLNQAGLEFLKKVLAYFSQQIVHCSVLVAQANMLSFRNSNLTMLLLDVFFTFSYVILM